MKSYLAIFLAAATISLADTNLHTVCTFDGSAYLPWAQFGDMSVDSFTNTSLVYNGGFLCDISSLSSNTTTTIKSNGNHQAYLNWWAGQVAVWAYASDTHSALGVSLSWLVGTNLLTVGERDGIHVDRENILEMQKLGSMPADFTITTNTVLTVTPIYEKVYP